MMANTQDRIVSHADKLTQKVENVDAELNTVDDVVKAFKKIRINLK